ncbi:hypothetical protein BaRGS_00024801 [Batillaria attramentaria]|uniref:Uncharacterized protein n=1 Tax=Batillaria attramentaria TaxID=370345 RepID=A0ABD0KA78_9CAEN
MGRREASGRAVCRDGGRRSQSKQTGAVCKQRPPAQKAHRGSTGHGKRSPQVASLGTVVRNLLRVVGNLSTVQRTQPVADDCLCVSHVSRIFRRPLKQLCRGNPCEVVRSPAHEISVRKPETRSKEPDTDRQR